MVTAESGSGAGMLAVELILRAEDRLERLLDSGWRNVGQDLVLLEEAAQVLAEAGMERLAGKLRSVSAAPSAADGLAAVTLALATCRLLRVRVGSVRGEGEWTPVGASGRRVAGRRRAADPGGQT